MRKTLEEIELALDAKIPRDEVSSRSGGGSKALSYLETWYVIDRLNKVFGNTSWDCETVEMIQVNPGDALPAYRAKVRIKALIPTGEGGYLQVIKEGTGWGSDKSKLNPHEMAVKEAESDALKRAAMKFGMSTGLALYDKSQENVEDAPVVAKSAPVPASAAAPTQSNEREALQKRITAMSKVVIAKKVKTLDELKADIKNKFSVDSAKDLSDTQAKELLTTLEGLANA